MNNDLISVVVPCYNVEKYLEKCVQSIVCQTYTNLEIIFIFCKRACDLIFKGE